MQYRSDPFTEAVETALRDIQVQAEVERRLLMAKAYGTEAENFFANNGTVLTFSKKFEVDGTAYLYAAIRAGGKWYLSGPTQQGQAYTYQELVAFLVGGAVPVPFDQVEHR